MFALLQAKIICCCMSEPSVDVAIENTAGLTSLELAKRGSVHPGIASRLQKKWESLKAEQENRSAAAEQELLALVNEEVKSDKSKSKAAKKSKRAGSARTATQKAPNQAEVTIEKVEEPLKASTTVIDSRDHSTVSATLDSSASASAIADDSSDWQSVSTKKNRECHTHHDKENVAAQLTEFDCLHRTEGGHNPRQGHQQTENHSSKEISTIRNGRP